MSPPPVWNPARVRFVRARMHRRALTITVAVLTVAAVACGSDDSTDTTTVERPATSTTDAADPPVTTTAGHDDLPALPDDPDAAFVVLDSGVPAITADGRVFERVADAQGFAAVAPPKPAIGALTVSQLTPEGLAQVLAFAHELGLLTDPPDYGDVGVTDQGDAITTLTTADGTFVHSVYAPGYETGDPDADAARERLAQFVRFVGALHTELGDDISHPEPYVPDQWIVNTSPYVSSGFAPAWPFDDAPVDGCVTLPLADSTDTVSGVYTLPDDTDTGRGHVVHVSPVLPFSDC